MTLTCSILRLFEFFAAILFAAGAWKPGFPATSLTGWQLQSESRTPRVTHCFTVRQFSVFSQQETTAASSRRAGD